MIRIERLTEWNQIDEMRPYFTVEKAGQEDELAQQLKQALASRPETVLVVQARREGELIGFIVCDLAIGQKHIWLAQAWSREGNSLKIADAMWEVVKEWMLVLGKYEVRAETRRSLNPLQRRFGFVPISTTILCDIRNSNNGKPVLQSESQEPEHVES